MSTPRVTMVRLIRVDFVRGDGVKTRCRDVTHYIDPADNKLVAEIDPCAGNEGLDGPAWGGKSRSRSGAGSGDE